MKILVMGAGALGTCFEGRLQAAGHDVTLVARGSPLAALREQGLRLESRAGDLDLPRVHVSDVPAADGTPDVVRAVEEALADCPSLDPEAGRKVPKANASMLDDLSGEIVRLGRRHGIPPPVHASVAAVLAPYVARQPRACCIIPR